MTIFALSKSLEEEVNDCDISTKEKIEQHLNTWTKALHENHYLVLKFKKRLLDLLEMEDDDKLDSESLRAKLERQISLGSEFLNVVEKIEPGYSMTRGRLLRQMHLPKLKLAKIKFNNKEIDKTEFLNIAKVAIKDMKIAVDCMEDFKDEEAEKLGLV